MTDTTLHTAIWLERRLDLSLGFHTPLARMYGVVVHDADALLDQHDTAARESFVAEHRDVYALIGQNGVLARSFDAAAVVTFGWAAPLDEDGSLPVRASRHPDRRRVRCVAVVDDLGLATVLRFEDEPERVIAEAGRGVGDVIDALVAMWFGDPTLLVQRFVNMRTTRGGCSRRP